MKLEYIIEAFSKLGKLLNAINNDRASISDVDHNFKESLTRLYEQVKISQNYNGWFTDEMVRYMISSISDSLKIENIKHWLKSYPGLNEANTDPKTIAIISAGNIPAVGFHDMLSVLITGNFCKMKLSSDDDKILPAIAEILFAIQPEFKRQIEFVKGKLSNFDAVIATGSNNTSRYFDHYFGKYQNIIRKNRNGVAVLNGDETDHQLRKLTDDIFMYYGLGCRNVSKLFVPKSYEFEALLKVLSERTEIAVNHKYFNNYEYNKAIYLINGDKFYDLGNLLLIENDGFSSPVSVVYFSFYDDLKSINEYLDIQKDKIQCIVSEVDGIKKSIPIGSSQKPALWDYADGVDTLDFILKL